MKRLMMIPLACLSLAGCAQLSGLLNPSASTQVVIAQGDASIDEAYNIAAQAYLAALPSMSASTKATVKPLMIKAYAAVQAADAAATAGSSSDLAAKITAATQAINDARAALVPQQ